jgi:hypothetical protein
MAEIAIIATDIAEVRLSGTVERPLTSGKEGSNKLLTLVSV